MVQLNFNNKRPRHQRKKEILVLFLIGIFLFSMIVYYYYIKYSPIYSLEYPRINITCEDELNYDDFVSCEFELNSKDESDNVETQNSKIKIRGSGTGWNEMAPKKGYRIELSLAKSLLGLREDDDWLLMAMYADYPRMRIKLSFDLYRTLLPSNPTAILPESKYVTLYINGEFQGLYLLVERNDRRLYGLNDASNSLDSSLIFQDKGNNIFDQYYPEKWEQDWPNDYDGIYIMDQILSELIDFVVNTEDNEFFNSTSGIYSKFEKINLIDYYIFNFFILHKDFWDCNYFIVRNSNPSKFFLVPWDFDKSFGQFAWNNYDSNYNAEEEIQEFNSLYNRLIGNDQFMLDCKIRWFDLRQTIWSEESILDMLSEIYESIESILEIETEKWDPGDLRNDWHNDVDKSVKTMYEWIPERLIFCDSYFESQNF